MNAFGPANTKLMAHLFEIQPEAVSLLHFIRQWLINQGFNHFQGYLVTLLVIFFCQNKNMMPTGKSVKGNVEPKIIINGEFIKYPFMSLILIKLVFLECECQFEKSRSLDDYGCLKVHDYKNHLQEFFEFYAEFDFKKIMSTVDGTAIAKNEYSRRFPKFVMEGILIAGLCNERKNCGVCDKNIKQDFIALCRASARFLAET